MSASYLFVFCLAFGITGVQSNFELYQLPSSTSFTKGIGILACGLVVLVPELKMALDNGQLLDSCWILEQFSQHISTLCGLRYRLLLLWCYGIEDRMSPHSERRRMLALFFRCEPCQGHLCLCRRAPLCRLQCAIGTFKQIRFRCENFCNLGSRWCSAGVQFELFNGQVLTCARTDLPHMRSFFFLFPWRQSNNCHKIPQLIMFFCTTS